MFFKNATPGDRLAAAHEHFNSAGMDLSKVIVLLVLAAGVGFLIYYAYKKK